MKKLGAFIYIVSGLALLLLVPMYVARAAQDDMPIGTNANISRPCNIEGATQQNVTTTATSARTSNTAHIGKIRVVCTGAAYMTSGVSAPTATTSHVYLNAGAAEEFYSSPAVKYAFIRASADGVCQVLECK